MEEVKGAPTRWIGIKPRPRGKQGWYTKCVGLSEGLLGRILIGSIEGKGRTRWGFQVVGKVRAKKIRSNREISVNLLFWSVGSHHPGPSFNETLVLVV